MNCGICGAKQDLVRRGGELETCVFKKLSFERSGFKKQVKAYVASVADLDVCDEC